MDGAALSGRFRELGVVRLDGAFTEEQAAGIRELVWRHIGQRSKVSLASPDSWGRAAAGSFGLKALQGRPEFAPVVDNEAVHAALDVLFEPDGWSAPKRPSAKVLLTFPEHAPWRMPRGWHIDFGLEQPTWPTFAVKVFAFFDLVEPAGGGTLLLEGSHRVVERFAQGRHEDLSTPAAHNELMHCDPWIEQLALGGSARHPRQELVGQWNDVLGVPVRVLELTGNPGDVVLAHMHVMHSPSPNAGTRPRQMLGLEITRQDRPPR